MSSLIRDTKGRAWDVRIDVAAMRRVEKLAGVKLQDVTNAELWERLASDVVAVVDVLFAILKPQADAAGVSDEQFAEGLNGEVIEAATEAITEGIEGFFRNSPLANVISKARAMMRARTETLTKLGE